MSRVFISDRLEAERMPFRSAGLQWGKAHYSWKLISRLYRDALSGGGFETENVVRPEIYQSKIAREVLGVRPDDVHLAVKPIEHLRPFHGVANLFVCGWEFPEFSDSDLGASPMLDQLSILRRADRVLCWTDFTRDNLRAAGLDNAVTLPPTIEEVQTSDSETALDMASLTLNSFKREPDRNYVPLRKRLTDAHEATLFTAVLNPFDRRKRLPTLIEGFQLALDSEAHMRLIVKLVIDNEGTTLANVNPILNIHFDYLARSEKVIFCADHLDEAAMAGFRGIGDFYIGAPSAEGLNLPAIEAALAGVPLVVPLNTAMGSYLNDNEVVPIAFEEKIASEPINGLVDYMAFTHFPPTAQAVCDAILEAKTMDASDRKAMAGRARRAVSSRFGAKRFAHDFTALLEEIA